MDYFDRPGLSFHQLKDLGTISPDYYYRAHVTKEIQRPTSAGMAFGTAVHAAVLEPERYAELVTICPPEFVTPSGGLSTAKAAKEWRDSLPEKACILSPFDHARAQHCADRVRKNHLAKKILHDARTETDYTTALAPGVAGKCKIDIIDSTGAVWDLKTIKNLDDIVDHAQDYCYIEQVDWYAATTFSGFGGLIVVESEEPHRVAVVHVGHGRQAQARKRWQAWLEKYQECQAQGVWPNDPLEPIVIYDL